MSASVGSKVPAASVRHKTEGGIDTLSTEDLFGGSKVVLFALPGAFTPTCSARHLPGFVAKAAEIKAKGVDKIVCLSVNDAFVMEAWGKDQNVGDAVMMVADGNGDLTKALGLGLDASGHGMGQRSQRYAMVVDDGTITGLFVEQPGAFDVSSAEHVLSQL